MARLWGNKVYQGNAIESLKKIINHKGIPMGIAGVQLEIFN
jgi:hypothetical protein